MIEKYFTLTLQKEDSFKRVDATQNQQACMNQAQQSAKWNPRDSMNFREQGAFTEGQKPLRNIQQQTERSLHRAGDKEMAGSSSVRTGRSGQHYRYARWGTAWGAVTLSTTAPTELGRDLQSCVRLE